LTGCSTAARLSGSEEQAIACKTGKQFLATKTRYRHVKRVKESEASSMLEWDILNYLKKWRTNLRATASESQQQFNIKYDKFRQFLKELCEQVARVAISSAVTTVMTSDIERNEGEKHFFERLKKENKLHQEFCTFLSRNMRNSFRNNLYDAVDSSNGSVNNDVVISRLTDVVRKKFLYDTDLDDLFAGEDGEKLRDTAEKNIIKAMEAIVKKLSVDANFKSLHSFPQLDVAITADELMNMPEEAIHSFKIKFSPRNYSVSQTDDDSLLEDFVMR